MPITGNIRQGCGIRNTHQNGQNSVCLKSFVGCSGQAAGWKYRLLTLVGKAEGGPETMDVLKGAMSPSDADVRCDVYRGLAHAAINNI